MAEILSFALRFVQFLAFKHIFVDSNDQNRGLYVGIHDDRAICRCIFTTFPGPLLDLVQLSNYLQSGCRKSAFFCTLDWNFAPNLDWKLARGPAMKICWSFVDCTSCNLGKLVLYGWAIIKDFSAFGSSEGGNKTLRVCSFCSKNY